MLLVGVPHPSPPFLRFQVAVKEILGDITPEVLEAFNTEVRLLRELQHGRIAQCIGTITRPAQAGEDWGLCLVMEHYPLSLLAFMRRTMREKLTPKLRAQIAREMAQVRAHGCSWAGAGLLDGWVIISASSGPGKLLTRTPHAAAKHYSRRAWPICTR